MRHTIDHIEEKKKIKALFEQGQSVDAIAEAIGRSRNSITNTIGGLLKSNKINLSKFNNKYGKLCGLEAAKVYFELINFGDTNRIAAHKMDLCPVVMNTVYQRIIRDDVLNELHYLGRTNHSVLQSINDGVLLDAKMSDKSKLNALKNLYKLRYLTEKQYKQYLYEIKNAEEVRKERAIEKALIFLKNNPVRWNVGSPQPTPRHYKERAYLVSLGQLLPREAIIA
jgi:phage regulator Rha-like protein